MLFPWAARRWALRAIFKFDIAPTATIGMSIVLPETLTMEEGSRIGHLTMIKGLGEVYLGRSATIGNLNWITGFPKGRSDFFSLVSDREPRLSMGDHSAITHRHMIDCTHTVLIGSYTTIAGWGSQILTHAIDLATNRQDAAPVHIGSYCFLGTRIVLLKGTVLADRTVLAAGAVATGNLTTSDRIYGGVPAREIGTVADSDKYFSRRVGRVQ